MNKMGQMVTGWNELNGRYYYMDSNGAMMKEVTTPDGYKINENGEWIE